MKTPAETRRIRASGSRFPRTMPRMIPRPSATTIPVVVPNRTATGLLVLDRQADRRELRLVADLGEEEGNGHRQEGAEGRAPLVLALQRVPADRPQPEQDEGEGRDEGDDLQGITVVRSRPATTARAWFRSVATKTAPRTVGAGKRVAKAMARSWVLSPISARVTKSREATKAVIGRSFPERPAGGRRGPRGATDGSVRSVARGPRRRFVDNSCEGWGRQRDRTEKRTGVRACRGSAGGIPDTPPRCDAANPIHKSSGTRARLDAPTLQRPTKALAPGGRSGHGYQKPRFVIVGIRGAERPALLLPLGRLEAYQACRAAGNEDRTDVRPARPRGAATLPPRPITRRG